MLRLRLNPRYVVHKSEKEEVQVCGGDRVRGTGEVLRVVGAEGGSSNHDRMIIHYCGRLSTCVARVAWLSWGHRKWDTEFIAGRRKHEDAKKRRVHQDCAMEGGQGHS